VQDLWDVKIPGKKKKKGLAASASGKKKPVRRSIKTVSSNQIKRAQVRELDQALFVNLWIDYC
jgi:hypothetical protein